MTKRLLPLMLACGIILSFQANAQIVVTIGAPYTYSSVYAPLSYSYYTSAQCASVYPAADMLAAGAPAGGGKIRSIAFYYTPYMYGGANGYYGNMYFGSTPLSNGATPNEIPIPDKVKVIDNRYFPRPAAAYNGWYTMMFDQPYVWNGSSNVAFTWCYSDLSGGTGTRWYNYAYIDYSSTGSYGVQYQYNYWLATQDFCANPTPPWSGYVYYYTNYYRPYVRFEICNAPPSVYDFSMPPIQYLPGNLPITWSLGRTAGTFNATVTFKMYTPGGQLAATQSFNVPIDANSQSGTYNFPISNLPAGYYRVEGTFMSMDECNNLVEHKLNRAVMVLSPGDTPCLVWPGDVDNDGVVNYQDRASLNKYIFDANLRTTWIKGPARYRVDGSPVTYFSWEAQPSVPWNTPQGCYMDADGNGTVNNLDYIAIKVNWLRTHGATPKEGQVSNAGFALEQNFPNPFNPSTTLSYTLPERSQVAIVVTDMLGREVATLVDEVREAGSFKADFDASGLSSGLYVARATMTGEQSGAVYTKTVKMTLSK